MTSGLIAYPRSRRQNGSSAPCGNPGHEENDDRNHRERMFAPYIRIVEPLKAGHKRPMRGRCDLEGCGGARQVTRLLFAKKELL